MLITYCVKILEKTERMKKKTKKTLEQIEFKLMKHTPKTIQ